MVNQSMDWQTQRQLEKMNFNTPGYIRLDIYSSYNFIFTIVLPKTTSKERIYMEVDTLSIKILIRDTYGRTVYENFNIDFYVNKVNCMLESQDVVKVQF